MPALFTILTVLSVAAGVAVAIAAREDSQFVQPMQRASFFSSYWENDYSTVNYENGAAGQFSIDWDNGFAGDFVIGKGYKPGGDMLLNYSGTFEADSNANAYLALYGWTTNPLVEYYVIESMGVHNPSDNASATLYGSLNSDGGTYEIWQKQRTDAPSIIGTATFQQYWSIRTKMHCGGTINTGNHFRAWEAAGLPLGTQNYLILGVEGQAGGGSANLTVGVLPTTPVIETPTPAQRTQTHHYSTHTATTTTTSVPTTTTAPVTSTHTTTSHTTSTRHGGSPATHVPKLVTF